MSYPQLVERNLKHFYLNSFFNGLIAIIGPIIVIYQLQVIGLSLTEVLIGEALFALAVLVMEIPSGVFADKYGRKNCLIMAEACTTICFGILAIATEFWQVICGQILIGIGLAFASGAKDALIYDSLQELKREGEYKSLLSRLNTITFSMSILSNISAGLVAWWFDMRIAVWLASVFCFCAFINIFFLTETKHKKISIETHFYEHLSTTVNYFLSQKILWLVVAWGVVTSISVKLGFHTLNPYWDLMGVPIIFFGVALASHNLIAALVSFNASKILGYFGDRKLMLILTGLGVVTFTLLSVLDLGILFAMLFPAFFQIQRALFPLIVDDALNRKSESHYRATMLSLSSFMRQGGQMIVLPLFGVVADLYSLLTGFLILAVLLLVLGSITLWGSFKYWN